MKIKNIFLMLLSIIILSGCSNISKNPLGTRKEESFCILLDAPNYVTSVTKEKDFRYIEPIKYNGNKKLAKEKIRKILLKDKHITIIKEDENYIHAESRSAIFKFVDDLEFYFPEDQNIIHIRSKSRLGYSDLGVNNRRLEKIKKEFYD